MSKKVSLRCQQVIDDISKRQCGRSAKYYPGLFAILCRQHAAYVRKELGRAFGIRTGEEKDA